MVRWPQVINLAHASRVRAVLELLRAYPPAEAAIALEDAYAAIAIGLSLGLAMDRIIVLVTEALVDELERPHA